MQNTYLSRHKESLSSFCLLMALIFPPSAYAGATPDKMSAQQGNDLADRIAEKEKITKKEEPECPPLITRDEDGRIHVRGGATRGEGKCRKRVAKNGERGFCKAVPNKSFVCKTEGMVGCDTTKADGGTCRTINTGDGLCDCVCK